MCQWQFICQETFTEHCLSVSTATHIDVSGDNYRCGEHYLPPTTHTSLINTVWMTVHLPLVSATCQGNTAYQHQHTYVWMTVHLPGDTQTYATQGMHAGMHTECNASELQNSGNPPPSPCPPPSPSPIPNKQVLFHDQLSTVGSSGLCCLCLCDSLFKC